MSKTKETKSVSVQALTLTMKQFQNLATRFSSDIPIMIRGRHGIGKSECVYQIAAKLELPVIERRLSQMTEGDIIGLPDLSEGRTQFRPVDWLMEATEKPVLLFLDELNRAIKGVEQATFQLADSKTFYGKRLHPKTRIFIACNIGENYNVEQFDPAAISRYAVIDLDPTAEDWIEWAQTKCNPLLVNFIRTNTHMLDHSGVFESNTKYQDRRAWARADRELTQMGLYDDVENPLFNHVVSSLVGPACGPAFWTFAIEKGKDISAEDVLKSWEKAKAKFPKDPIDFNVKVMEVAWKIDAYVKKLGKLEDSQIKELAAFCMDNMHPEAILVIWKTACENQENLMNLYFEGAFKNLPVLAAKGQLPTTMPEKKAEEEKKEEAKTEDSPAAEATEEDKQAATPSPKKKTGRPKKAMPKKAKVAEPKENEEEEEKSSSQNESSDSE